MTSWSDCWHSIISRNIFFSTFLLLFVIRAQSPPIGLGFGTWIYPVKHGDRDRPVFNYLDSVNASWTSIWDAPWLHLWCTSNVGPSIQEHLFQERTIPLKPNFLVALDHQAASNRCHFQITPSRAGGGRVDSVNSPNFKILQEPNRRPKLWSLNAAVDDVQNQPNDPDNTIVFVNSLTSSSTTNSFIPSSTANILTPPSTNNSPTTSSTPPASLVTSNEPSSDGLSTAAKAGIGLVCSCLALALIAATTYLARGQRRRREATVLESRHEREVGLNPMGPDALIELGTTCMNEMDSGRVPELNSRTLIELDTTRLNELDGGHVGELVEGGRGSR